MKPRVIAIIQARMGSSRLPGKVLKPVLGEPMLAREIERLERCSSLDAIVVATSTKPADDAIAEVVKRTSSAEVFRGSEEDVLQRYRHAAETFAADIVVRLTGDCPIIEPRVVDRCVAVFRETPHADYVSNTRIRSYPRGLDTEVFHLDALRTADAEASARHEREHVTPFVWQRPDRFRIVDVTDDADRSYVRLTVDAPEDFELIRRIYEHLYPSDPAFTYRHVLDLLEERPDLKRLNDSVQQKSITP